MQYTFELAAIGIKTTRSRVADTDYASMSIAAIDAAGATGNPTTVTKFLGDLGPGTHGADLSIQGVEVPDGGKVAIAVTVLNHGSGPSSEIRTLIESVTTGMVGLAATTLIAFELSVPVAGWIAALGTAVGAGVLAAWKTLDADCDGPVVGTNFVLPRSALDEQTETMPWFFTQRYPGIDSASGCGANSDYAAGYLVGKPGQAWHGLGTALRVP